jgi:hypothetical protein
VWQQIVSLDSDRSISVERDNYDETASLIQGQPCRLFQRTQAVNIASIINFQPHEDENLVSAVDQDIESFTRQVWFIWPYDRFSTRTEKVGDILNGAAEEWAAGKECPSDV